MISIHIIFVINGLDINVSKKKVIILKLLLFTSIKIIEFFLLVSFLDF